MPGNEPVSVGVKHRLRRAERRISAQHRQLDDFFAQVLSALDRGAVHSASEFFVRLSDALEAHLSIEEELYFPSLRALRPSVRDEIDRLCEEHVHIRSDLARIGALLRAGEGELSSEGVDALAERLMLHESKEERLVAETS